MLHVLLRENMVVEFSQEKVKFFGARVGRIAIGV